MGQYADNYERAEENWGAFEAHRWLPSRPVSQVVRAPVFQCAACSAEFGAESALHRHIHAEHPRSSYYVRVNGAIVHDLVFIEEALHRLEVVPVGGRDLQLRVRWSNGVDVSRTISFGNALDLATVFGPVTAPGEVRLWVTVDGPERFHRIYVIQPPEIDFSIPDELVLEAQQPLLEGGIARYEPLRDAAEREDDETLRRYLRGFASYLLGCNLELQQRWQPARERFDEAYALLRPFRVALARDVHGVLDFRRHDLNALRRRGKSSVWWQAASFFGTPPAVVRAAVAPADGGIWIDDYQTGLLTAVQAECAGQHTAALDTLRRLPTAPDAELGNAQKRHIASARIAAACGDRSLAKTFYLKLRDDRMYATEAAQWL